jgi:hypothetical protein
MSPIAETSVIVPDREVDEERTSESEPPRIRCPLCGWSPRKATASYVPADLNGIHFDTRGGRPA